MATFTMSLADLFPTGAVVNVYRQRGLVSGTDAPFGKVITTGTVASDGTATFTGLAEGAAYVAAAPFAGTWRSRSFRTDTTGLTSGSSGDGGETVVVDISDADLAALEAAIAALQAAVAANTAGLAGKQDASTAATDTELATKQDASSAATDAELTAGLAGKSNVGHTHDDRYYTESEVDALIAGVDPGTGGPGLPTGGPGFLQRLAEDGTPVWGTPATVLPTGGPGILTRSAPDDTPTWVPLPTLESLGLAVRVVPGLDGVHGDGSHDDAAAIQALIDYAALHDRPIEITPPLNDSYYKVLSRLDVPVTFGGRLVDCGGAEIRRTNTMAATDDILRICASDVVVMHPNTKGASGTPGTRAGTGVKIGRPDQDQPNGVWIMTPRCENLGAGVEFGCQTSGGSASTGDSVVWGGRIRLCDDGILNRAFVNYVMGNPFISEVARGVTQSTDRNSGRTVVQSATINQWSDAAIDFKRGRGNTVEEMWCEHTATQTGGVPTEIVRVGSSAYTAVNTNIGTLHLHAQFHNPGGASDPSQNFGVAELYSMRLVRSRGLRCRHLEVTNELPQTAIVRVDLHAENVNNRFERISCGDVLPNAAADGGVWTHSRLLSDANVASQRAVTMYDVPGFAGDAGGTTLHGHPSPQHTYTIFRDADETKARYWARRRDGGFVTASEDSTSGSGRSGFKTVIESVAGPRVSILLTPGLFKFLDTPLGNEPWAADQDHGSYVDCYEMTIDGSGKGITRVVNRTNSGFQGNTGQSAVDVEPFSYTNARQAKIRYMTIEACGFAKGSTDAIDFDQGLMCEVIEDEVLASRARGLVVDGGDNGRMSGRNRSRGLIIQGRPYEVQGIPTPTGGTLTAQTYAYSIVDRVRDLNIGTPTAYTYSAGVATITMAAHGLIVGDTVCVVAPGAPGAVTSAWNRADVPVTVVTDANTFKIAGFGADPGALPAGIAIITPTNTEPSEPTEINHADAVSPTSTNKTALTWGRGHYNVIGREVHRWDATNGWRKLTYITGNADGTYTDTGAAGTASVFTFQHSVQGTGVQCLGSSNNDFEAFIDGCGGTGVAAVGYGFDAVMKGEGTTHAQTADNNVFRGSVSRSILSGVRFRSGSRNKSLVEIRNVGTASKVAGAKVDSATGVAAGDNVIDGRVWEDVQPWQWYSKAGVTATAGSYLAMTTGVQVATSDCARTQIDADIRVKHTLAGVKAIADAGSNTHVRASGFNDQVVSSTGSRTGVQGDRVVLMSASGGPAVYTLPPAAADLEIVLKKTDATANAVTVAAAGSDTTDVVSLTVQGAVARLLSRATGWIAL